MCSWHMDRWHSVGVVMGYTNWQVPVVYYDVLVACR